ncbi:MAG TPA: hypothetical protein VGD59_04610 [Acidisarcina sp.]
MNARPHTRRPAAYQRPIPNRRKKSGRSWWLWWPVLAGVLVTPLARRSAAVLALEGPGALQTLYPWIALLRLHLFGLSEQWTSSLTQIVMYVQFPLYGLFMALTMRSHGVARSLMWTILLHALPLAFLIAAAYA